MPAPYVGQQDYRGFLNYLGTQGDKVAGSLLGIVGNDAKFDPTKQSTLVQQQANKAYYDLYNQSRQPTSKPNYAGIGGAGTVYAPPLDIASINAQARKSAAKAVNPYYTKQLNLFLNRQKQLRAQEQAQYDTNVKNIEDTLAQTLESSQINRERTTEDVAQNVADINQQADIAQTDQGQEFTQARLDAARQAGGQGGLAAQGTEQLQEQQNIAETRQTQQFQQAKAQQEQFKGRSLQDLLRSDTLAKTGAEKGKKQAKFDLDNYIKAQEYEKTTTKRSLEKQRLADLAQEEAKQRAKRVLRFVEGIADPAKKAAAYSTYGSYI